MTDKATEQATLDPEWPERQSGERYSVRTVAEALRLTGGIRSAAAEKLDCSPSTITNYIDRYPEFLLPVLQEAEENTLDLAEATLITLIRDKDAGSVRFYLQTKGKRRGYTTQIGLTGPDGGPVAVRPDLSAYSEEQIRAIRDIHRSARTPT